MEDEENIKPLLNQFKEEIKNKNLKKEHIGKLKVKIQSQIKALEDLNRANDLEERMDIKLTRREEQRAMEWFKEDKDRKKVEVEYMVYIQPQYNLLGTDFVAVSLTEMLRNITEVQLVYASIPVLPDPKPRFMFIKIKEMTPTNIILGENSGAGPQNALAIISTDVSHQNASITVSNPPFKAKFVQGIHRLTKLTVSIVDKDDRPINFKEQSGMIQLVFKIISNEYRDTQSNQFIRA